MSLSVNGVGMNCSKMTSFAGKKNNMVKMVQIFTDVTKENKGLNKTSNAVYVMASKIMNSAFMQTLKRCMGA